MANACTAAAITLECVAAEDISSSARGTESKTSIGALVYSCCLIFLFHSLPVCLWALSGGKQGLDKTVLLKEQKK